MYALIAHIALHVVRVIIWFQTDVRCALSAVVLAPFHLGIPVLVVLILTT